VAKSTIRAYGTATSQARPVPDFLIIGAKRGGTTSMFNALLEHPQVPPLFPRPQKIKGVHYFDTRYHRGMAWYRSHFPTAASRRRWERASGARTVVGEASPYYLFHPLAAERAARDLPEARIIVLLRNPVDRAFSHYRERVRHGVETLPFEAALDREPDRLRGEEERLARGDRGAGFAHEHLSYVAQGRYARSLDRWLAGYPRERVLVLRSEDFYGDPLAAYRRVEGFLGLEPFRPPRLARYNYHAGPGMDPATRARLLDLFAPENERLSAMVDLDTSEWSR
jgi:hypothetical protein